MDASRNSTLITAGVWDAVRKANRGDQEALSLVEGMLSGPEASELLSIAGDMAYQALEATLTMGLGAEEDGSKTIIRAQTAQLRNELGWVGASDLERLAIERVVLGWLAVHFAEMRLAQYNEDSIAFAKYLDDRLCKAEKRYRSALRTLAGLRKDAGISQVRVQVSTTMATR